jgi:hypothetical protein
VGCLLRCCHGWVGWGGGGHQEMVDLGVRMDLDEPMVHRHRPPPTSQLPSHMTMSIISFLVLVNESY